VPAMSSSLHGLTSGAELIHDLLHMDRVPDHGSVEPLGSPSGGLPVSDSTGGASRIYFSRMAEKWPSHSSSKLPGRGVSY
jgi:hypothetical protein